MKTIEITDRDTAMIFGKQAFQIVFREGIKAIFALALLGGIEWLGYRFLGDEVVWGLSIFIMPSVLFGIPYFFREGVQGGISNLLMGRVEPKFLGFGPDKIG